MLRLSCTYSGSFSPGQQTLTSQESVCDTTATRTQNCLRMPQNHSQKAQLPPHAVRYPCLAEGATLFWQDLVLTLMAEDPGMQAPSNMRSNNSADSSSLDDHNSPSLNDSSKSGTSLSSLLLLSLPSTGISSFS